MVGDAGCIRCFAKRTPSKSGTSHSCPALHWHGDLRALEEWRRLSTKVLNPEVPAFAQMLRLGEPV